MAGPHVSVLLTEAVDLLAPVDGGIYVDGNLGFGGHTEAILKRSAPGGRVLGFDMDATALAASKERLAAAGVADRVTFLHRNFAELQSVLDEMGVQEVNGILLDLGLSSHQLDNSARGFSFQRDEPLDMRMDIRNETTAATLVNELKAEELADIFYYFGEERQSRRIAAAIIDYRKKTRLTTASQLADVIEGSVPRRFHPKRIHVATKVFQALRIAVNGELDSLRQILSDGIPLLAPGGRFCVISFHSLEDRMVKRAFRDSENLTVVTRKPVKPGETEISTNPRARSARLRGAEKRRTGDGA